MGALITKLTPEQQAQVPIYLEKWLKIGLSTGPGDRAAAEDAVRRIYEASGRKPPQTIVWLSSPFYLVRTRPSLSDHQR